MTPPMTASTLTPTTATQAAYERALERADSAHVDVIGAGRLTNGSRFYIVPALSEPGRVHVVRIVGAHLECDCPAGAHGRLCMHRAVVHRVLAGQSAQRRKLA